MHIDDKLIDVVSLNSELVAEAAKVLETAPDAWNEAQVRAELSNKNSIFLCAVCDNKVLGVCVFSVVCDEATLQNIAVLPSVRGRNIATELLQFSLELLKGEGVTSLFLEVRCSNIAAISLYEKLGFERVSRRKNLYEHPSEDGWLYRLRLLTPLLR